MIISVFGQLLLAVACASFIGSAGAMVTLQSSRYGITAFRAYRVAIWAAAVSFASLLLAFLIG